MRWVKFPSVAVLTSSLSLIVSGCSAEAGDKPPPLSNEDMLAATRQVYGPDSVHLDENAQPEAKARTLSQAGFWTAWKLENGRPPAVGLTTKMLDGSAVRIEYAGPSNMFIDVSEPPF